LPQNKITSNDHGIFTLFVDAEIWFMLMLMLKYYIPWPKSCSDAHVHAGSFNLSSLACVGPTGRDTKHLEHMKRSADFPIEKKLIARSPQLYPSFVPTYHLILFLLPTWARK